MQSIINIIGDSDIALLLVVLGVLGICVEFCRPGLIAPGVTGGVLVLLGVASLVRLGAPSLILSVAALFVLTFVTGFLLSVAARARRNKLKS